MKSIFRVIIYLRRYPFLAVGQMTCALLMALAVIIFPLVTRHILGVTIPEGRTREFLPWILLALLGFFFKDALNSARIILNNHFEQKVIFDIRSDLYSKIQNLPLRWFDHRRTGDLMTRVVEDVTNMERILIDGIEFGLVALVQIIAVGCTMFFFDAQTAIWATLPIPFLLTGAGVYTFCGRNRFKNQREAASNLNVLLHDNIAGIRQIKTYAAEEQEHRRFNENSSLLRQATLRLMRWWAVYSPGMSFLGMIGYVFVLGFGGWRVMHGEMKIEDLVGIFLLLSLFYEPVSRLHQLNQISLQSRAAADRVFEILDTEEEHEPPVDKQERLPSNLQGHLNLENVSFSYEDTPTLHHVNFTIQPGETHALIGATGAGKSTLMNLLVRFYQPQEGQITVDGQNIQSLSKHELRSALGYVTQEAFLFNGTVRENLLLAKPGSSEEELWKALGTSRAEEFVRKLPNSLDSIIGERGIKLSGGERQRLSIARALLKNPKILLLDEATASVDTATEKLIQAALDELMKNRTALVIAHRLSTIVNATCIHVLDAGRIVESGTHEELLNKEGHYRKLHEAQKLFHSPNI